MPFWVQLQNRVCAPECTASSNAPCGCSEGAVLLALVQLCCWGDLSAPHFNGWLVVVTRGTTKGTTESTKLLYHDSWRRPYTWLTTHLGTAPHTTGGVDRATCKKADRRIETDSNTVAVRSMRMCAVWFVWKSAFEYNKMCECGFLVIDDFCPSRLRLSCKEVNTVHWTLFTEQTWEFFACAATRD